MKADIEKKTQVIYDVYDYAGKYGSFDTLKEARIAFKQIKEKYNKGSIVKRTYEYLEIKTEVVLQSA